MPSPSQDHLKAAIAAATRAAENARRVMNSDETKLQSLIESLQELSELRVEEGEFMRAESLLREAMFSIQDAQKTHRQKPKPVLAANVATNLGFLYDRWGKLSKAREWYGKSLQLATEGGFLDSDLGASVSNNLGMIEKKSGNIETAEEHYRTALRVFELLKGEQSPEVSAVLNNLGVLLYTAKRWPEAQEMHERALALRQKSHDPATGAGMGDLRQSWQNLAAVLKARGELEKAATLLRQAGLQEEAPEVTPSWIVKDFRAAGEGLLAEKGRTKTSPVPLASGPRHGFTVQTFGKKE
jgi:tetratricopeptide (TPR) repeat protein